MPIPDFQTIMLPFLKSLEDGQEHQMREIIEVVAGTIIIAPSMI